MSETSEVQTTTGITARVYRKYIMGDSITDAELRTAINTLKPALDLLWDLGAEFRLPHKELDKVHRDLRSYQNERRMTKARKRKHGGV